MAGTDGALGRWTCRLDTARTPTIRKPSGSAENSRRPVIEVSLVSGNLSTCSIGRALESRSWAVSLTHPSVSSRTRSWSFTMISTTSPVDRSDTGARNTQYGFSVFSCTADLTLETTRGSSVADLLGMKLTVRTVTYGRSE